MLDVPRTLHEHATAETVMKPLYLHCGVPLMRTKPPMLNTAPPLTSREVPADRAVGDSQVAAVGYRAAEVLGLGCFPV